MSTGACVCVCVRAHARACVCVFVLEEEGTLTVHPELLEVVLAAKYLA